MDELKVQLITRDFNRMLEEFASLDPAVEFRTIVRGVAVRVIAGALRRTRAAQVASIRRDHAAREWITLDGKKYNLAYHYHNDALWGRIDRRRADDLSRRLGARGLAKQSWLHLARDLGATIEVPAYVDRANYDGLQYPINAAHVERRGGADYSLTILNSSPIVQNAGGRLALLSAMAAETRYFYTLLARGGFATAARRASHYSGVYVTPAALPPAA